MAIRRVWYSSIGLQSGLTVTAKLYDEKNVLIQDNIAFMEMPQYPVYYADVTFPQQSKSMMIVFENGSFVMMNVFDYTVIPGMVTYRIG